jgi:RNA polymerase sigma-70 factor (ECF subfamily)
MTATEPPTSPEPQSTIATRASLLSRLRDHGDHRSWQQFYEVYHRLILSVARRAGLDEADAQEAMQETIITVSKEMPDFRYDPAKGSFKNWLLVIARHRIMDQMRKRYRARMANRLDPDMTSVEEEINRQLGGRDALADVWEDEWKKRLLEEAMQRVRKQSKPQQFQMFEKTTMEGWSVAETARAFDVSQMTVYLARHRIGGMIKKEVKRLTEKMI